MSAFGSERLRNSGSLDDDNVDVTPPVSEDGSVVEEQPEEKSLATLEKEIADETWDFKDVHKEITERDNLKNKFLKEHRRTVRSRNHLGSNIFHVLARLTEKKISKLKLLVYWVVKEAGDLLTQPDTQGLTGFHLAIQNGNHKMVRYVLDAYDRASKEKGWNIENILNVTQNGNNSLHLAMKFMTPVPQKETSWLDTIDMLIDNASTDTLTMQNDHGFTPLHLAVEGNKCTMQQLAIVKKLIETCDAALDVRGTSTKTSFSPYQYHKATVGDCPTIEEWRKAQAKQTSLPGAKTDHRTLNNNAPSDNAKPPPLSKEKPRGKGNEDPLDSAPTYHGHKPNEVAAGIHSQMTAKASGGTYGQGSNMKKSRVKPTAAMDVKEAEHISSTAPRQQHQQQQQQQQDPSAPLGTTTRPKEMSKSKSQSLNDMVTMESADEVARYLKRTYLRTRSRRKALEFLYGGVSDTQVDFNLYGKEGEITEEDFKTGYKCAKLEDTLQFVRIPYLIIKPAQPSAPNGELDEDGGGGGGVLSENNTQQKEMLVGRTDLGIIFRWLRADAGVEKIIKLIVDDSRDPPHCDEEIENAVKPFGVEIWDWIKTDLCCETIAKIAPNARQINLYWSGKNAVLRGWSDPEGGLARLPDLEQIVIFLQSGTEGRSRNLKNYKAFKDRLERRRKDLNKKPINIKLADTGSHRPAVQTPRVKNEEALQNHRWLKCMESFSRFIVNVRIKDSQLQHQQQQKQKQQRFLQAIKIAIIDDGIDTTERKLHGRITGGQCFCAQDESPSFCVSAGGHGTMMARLVTRVFPQAEIISLKLDEHPQSDGSSQFSVQSAADAVRYAQKLGASIINMSWSIEPTEANRSSLADLERAIDLAHDSKILMFCAANDQGKTKDMSYPGKFSRGPRGTLYKIGAATATGGEYHYVSLNDVDFLFPGRVVEKEQDEEAAAAATDDAAAMGAARLKSRSTEGSSLATAFASGLAGLILHILQLVSHYHRESGDHDDDCDDGGAAGLDDGGLAKMYQSVKSDPIKMKGIFERLATEKKFVEVWKVFDDAEEAWRTGGRHHDNKMRILNKICTSLLTGLN